jgi:hypothetical protein
MLSCDGQPISAQDQSCAGDLQWLVSVDVLAPTEFELNPIEKAWNIIKSQWRKTSFIMLDNNRKTQEKISDAVDFIQSIADGQDIEKMKKVAQ